MMGRKLTTRLVVWNDRHPKGAPMRADLLVGLTTWPLIRCVSERQLTAFAFAKADCRQRPKFC